eukprot:scaffold11127_cov73-Amphora_coffeaeformis.AAC.1
MNNPSSSETFNVLIDSGCSISCTGFKDDFHGELAMGNFGYVNTANGQAKLDGFGMQSLFVFCPHKIIADTTTLILQITNYRGTSSWMSIDVKCSDDKNDFSIETVLAHIAPDSRLPFLCAERGHHEINESKETRCHCHVTSVYDVRNTNLSAARAEDQSMPDFDGHPTSGLPCLLARDSAQLKCAIPLCKACELA